MRKFSSYLQVPVFLPEYLNFFSKQPIKQFANKFPSFSNRKDHKILFNLIFVYWQKPSSNVRQIKVIQLHVSVSKPFPVGNYLLKVKNRNTKTRCEKSSKLTIKISNCQTNRDNIATCFSIKALFQTILTCSKLTIEILKQGVKYVQS